MPPTIGHIPSPAAAVAPAAAGPLRARGGQDGRFIVGRNTTDAFAPATVGTTRYDLTDGGGHNRGSRRPSPSINGDPDVPRIPGLVDGDEAYDPIVKPQVGAGGGGYHKPLLSGGDQRWAEFGGIGPEVPAELPAESVYALTVSENASLFNVVATGYYEARATSLGNGDAIYLTAQPGIPGDANLDGFVNDDDLSLLLANWTGAPAVSLVVPEPSVLFLLAAGGVALVRRRRCG